MSFEGLKLFKLNQFNHQVWMQKPLDSILSTDQK